MRRRVAILILAAYAALALSTALGTSVAGAGLDPVWAAAQRRGVLRVAVDFGYLPFSGMRGAEPYGYDVDLARALAEQLGLRVEFVPSNLDSIYDDLQADRADLAVSALPYAPEQGWRARFSSFYLNAGQVLLVPVGSALTRDTLGGRRIGAALGSDAAAELRRMARADLTLRVQDSYDLPPDAVAALVRGELDAAVVDNVAALTAINGGAPVRIAAALTLEPYVVAMPVAGFALNERVNAALEDLRRAGRFEELGAKWFR